MKTIHIINRFGILATAFSFAICGVLRAEAEVTIRGTIRSFEPKTFVINSESASEPTTYSYTTTTRYVDESGKVVTRETITPGAPVTVYYVREGDKMVANRVVVHKTTTTTTTEPGRPLTKKEAKELREAREHPEREARRAAEKGKPFPPPNPSETTTTTTTTTTSEGTIASVTPEGFVVTTRTKEGPLTYRYTKTTQYVDESGAPVTMEVIKSGVPVTVTYVREGDGFIAQHVIVHTRPALRR